MIPSEKSYAVPGTAATGISNRYEHAQSADFVPDKNHCNVVVKNTIKQRPYTPQKAQNLCYALLRSGGLVCGGGGGIDDETKS